MLENFLSFIIPFVQELKDYAALSRRDLDGEITRGLLAGGVICMFLMMVFWGVVLVILF